MNTEIQRVPDMAAIEQVLAVGDLSKLTPTQRVVYYNEVCRTIGVNSLTRPFEFITLNGKLTLYARKDCTDQLRSNRRVSITIVTKEKTEDVWIVTARASMPDGRVDEATGAVSLANLKGEALANAIMKAETKAKRRATLSICGLGFADESEIDDRVAYDTATGEVQDAESLPDFGAMIDAADKQEALTAIAQEIEKATRAGRINADARKTIGARFLARKKALESNAAASAS